MMPRMNGYEVAKKVRAERRGTPILMLTAKSELEDEIEGLNAGASALKNRLPGKQSVAYASVIE